MSEISTSNFFIGPNFLFGSTHSKRCLKFQKKILNTCQNSEIKMKGQRVLLVIGTRNHPDFVFLLNNTDRCIDINAVDSINQGHAKQLLVLLKSGALLDWKRERKTDISCYVDVALPLPWLYGYGMDGFLYG